MPWDEAQGGIDTATRRTNQMAALSSASTTLQTALAALSGSTPTQAQLDAANSALTALNGAIADAADLTDEEKAPYQHEADNAAAPISTAQAAKDKADDDADDAADKAMVATAMKLYDGIGSAPLTSTGDGQRTAMYSGDGDANITVTFDVVDGADGDDIVQSLTEDKKATVAELDGWMGKKFTAEPSGGGTYEARVYSYVGEPTEGAAFSTLYSDNFADGVLNETTTESAANADKVASPRFDQSAGVKSFEKGSNDIAVKISGTFHGVSGTYSCNPGSGNKCAVRVAAAGFNLGGVTSADVFGADNAAWTFKPTTATDKVKSTPDADYESYGWWVHTAANGNLTVSAFVDNKGADRVTLGIGSLRGTATYTGGAAGQYAISNPTGSPNDAGAFTADVELNATFAAEHTISGTIDNFKGYDGKSRDWSVELKEAAIADSGGISRSAADDTVWTIGGTAAPASGEWSGSLQEVKAEVPTVATGTFYSSYNRDGRMVGAFGANKE